MEYHCPPGGAAGDAAACEACSRLPSNLATLAAANCTAGSLKMICSGRAAGMQPPPPPPVAAARPPPAAAAAAAAGPARSTPTEEKLERQLEDVRRENAELASRVAVLEATVARLVDAQTGM